MLISSTGTLILTEMGQIHVVSLLRSESIQFINSDVSDTYYFEKYSDGILLRQYITSQREVAEDFGTGMIDIEADFLDQIWEITEIYLQNNFIEKVFDLKFKQFRLKLKTT